ncbi:hypothetical protein BS78_09G211900 [Paspalum vaginatum]|nr:hypothetical protein BS78_09G211900 [Paspalum vaginatum]
MGSRGGKASTLSSLLEPVWACLLALCLLLSCGCSPCQGRKLLADDGEAGGKVMYFEGGLRVPPGIANASGSGSGGESSPVAPALKGNKGFSTAPGAGREARLMRSVPSPGVGH